MVLLLLPLAVIAALSSAFVGYKYFQRKFPPLTDDDLPTNIRGATANDMISLHSVSSLSASEKEAIYKAFHDGDDFQWVANYDSTTSSSMPPDKEKETRRWNLTKYMIDCIFVFAERYGHMVVARSKNEGAFLGAVCIIPPYQSHHQFMAHLIRAVLVLGKPPTGGMGPEVDARLSAFGDTLTEHHTIMKDCKPHWYVGTLGVAETAQGKGVGRILNHVTIAIANGDPIYLECHNENVAFYKKMGYEVKKHFNLVPKTKNSVTFPFNGMTHGYQLK